jgi:glucose/arabinose dehydrogenase
MKSAGRLLRCCLISGLLLSFIPSTQGATLPPGFAETLITSDLQSPTAMAFAPDGRLFVCQQGGQLRVIKNGTLLATPFLTVSTDSTGERGLLGVAFDPDFDTNHFVYVYYTALASPIHNRVSRFTANGDVALAGSETPILDLDPLTGATNHNGGALHFGPDGKLYIAVGENATPSNSQTLTNLLGKILRLNPDGSIPSDNPFFNTAAGKNRAVWALGLRNPYTFAFQPGTGRMFINDVGQNTWEEVNDGVKGANYGWPNTEGPTSDPNFRGPLFAYQHGASATTGCAITGGTFYNPATGQFPSAYVGKYFFSDFCSGWIRLLNPANNTATAFATGIASPVDLQVASDGSLYYLARGDGSVRRIRYTASQAPTISQHPASKTVSVGQSATFTVQASGTAPLGYQWQRNGVNIGGATSASYTLTNAQASDSGAKFRAVVTNSFGTATSNPATLTVTSNQPPAGSITAPAAGALYKAGDTINYAGAGTDPEDGTLPASAFTWRVDFHHDAHVHPFKAATTGAKSGSFTIPTVGETSANVFYRITLTVKDSKGLTHTTTRDVRPRKVTLTLASSPAGLQLKLDGQPFTAPKSVVSVVGMRRSVSAVTPQAAGDVFYQFASWSADGGAATHYIYTPAANTTYTAKFNLMSQRLSFAASAYSVGEGTGQVLITVKRTFGTRGEALVDYATGGGTATEGSDYTRRSGTLRFLDGQTSKTFTLLVANDALDEPDETVRLILTNPRGAVIVSPRATTVTIKDNDGTAGATALSGAAVAPDGGTAALKDTADGGGDAAAWFMGAVGGGPRQVEAISEVGPYPGFLGQDSCLSNLLWAYVICPTSEYRFSARPLSLNSGELRATFRRP